MRDSSPLPDHAAMLTIDAAALAANWRQMQARAGKAECGAAVKADAYGLGVGMVAPILTRAGCKTFFVAHLSEAQALRAVAPDAVVYVLNGLPKGGAEAYAALRARPVLGSREEVAEWTASGRGQPAALHVDTGMNRLGLRVEEFEALFQSGALNDFNLALLMSHFVSSEERDDVLNRRQAERFALVRARLPHIPASLWNSSAHFLDGLSPYELTRPGYALYGGNVTPGLANPMRDVVRLEAPVMQLRFVRKGESVGYNAQWTARRDSRIATISLGYADGWHRTQSATDTRAGGLALLHGVPCPFAGRVSMDLVTLDVTDLPEEAVQRGDRAVLLGDGIGVDDVARRAGTNGYEVLTNLGKRYRRQIIGE